MVAVRRSSPPRARDCISPDGLTVKVVAAIQLRTHRLVSPARRRADQLSFCAAVAYAAHPLLGHGAICFPVVAKVGVERYGGVANSLSGPPSPGQLALPAALGTRWSPCHRPSRDAQTEDLRSPTSTGLGRGVAAPFARRRPNRECALTRWEPADNETLIPQQPRAHGRAPLPLLPPPCYHPPASPEGALAVACTAAPCAVGAVRRNARSTMECANSAGCV